MSEMNRVRTKKSSRRWLMTALGCVAAVMLFVGTAGAEQLKPFPKHWGEPPKIQLRDYVEWPGGYGKGSSTVANWIRENMKKDQAGRSSEEVLYKMDFDSIEPGKLPDDFLVLNGDFAVRDVEGRRVMELPGTPLDSFAVMFGPAGNENMEVSVRIQAASSGRRYPMFGLGMNGLGGYRLNVVPAKRAIELFRGPEDGGEVVARERFAWKSGAWVNLKLRVVKAAEGTWRVDGKVWREGNVEPTDWSVSYIEKEKPLPGRPVVAASPYSGTPILFDDLVVRKAVK